MKVGTQYTNMPTGRDNEKKRGFGHTSRAPKTTTQTVQHGSLNNGGGKKGGKRNELWHGSKKSEEGLGSSAPRTNGRNNNLSRIQNHGHGRGRAQVKFEWDSVRIHGS
jgi:hypothetical protein